MINYHTFLKDLLEIPDHIDLLDPRNFHKFIQAVLIFTQEYPEHKLEIAPITVYHSNFIESYIQISCVSLIKLTEEQLIQLKEIIKTTDWENK